MTRFDDDFAWQRRYELAVRRVLGECLIGPAPIEEDRRRNTDFQWVMRVEEARIACRIRHYPTTLSWFDQFTIRSALASGAPTELDKVRDGWGNFMLYAIAHPFEGRFELVEWRFIDLDVFRRAEPGARFEEIANRGPRPSTFRVYRYADLPRGLVRNQLVLKSDVRRRGMRACVGQSA